MWSFYRYGGAWGYITDTPGAGLIQLGARFYWPAIGRFLQQDPEGDGDNWYAYAEGNPVTEIDAEWPVAEGALAGKTTGTGRARRGRGRGPSTATRPPGTPMRLRACSRIDVCSGRASGIGQESGLHHA